jgi:hypothetical protein
VLKSEKVKEKIIELNTFDQLFHGKNIEGDIIGKYSTMSAFLNGNRTFTLNGITRRKDLGNVIFLYAEGEFYGSFNVLFYADGFIITADDEKDGTFLAERYPNIIGLSDESIGKLREYVRPLILEAYKKAMVF